MWWDKIISHTHYILVLIRHFNDDLTTTIITSPPHAEVRSEWIALGEFGCWHTPFSHTCPYHSAHNQHEALSDLCLSSAMVSVSWTALSSLKMTADFPKLVYVCIKGLQLYTLCIHVSLLCVIIISFRTTFFSTERGALVQHLGSEL